MITEVEYNEAAWENLGFCTHCQDFTHNSVEPDAHHYECPECGRKTVFGAEEALIMMLITF